MKRSTLGDGSPTNGGATDGMQQRIKSSPMTIDVQFASSADRETTTTKYMSGFGNSFETEALPGALPVLRRNSPEIREGC